MFKIGFGNDIHRLEAGLPLMIGGVQIESTKGAIGHSDADVLLHAITDAILGALALGDIGKHFPPGDPLWKDANSSVFLERAIETAQQLGFSIVNLDSTISLETPRLRPYIDSMRANLAGLLKTDLASVSVKAKTSEGVDSVGRQEAIRAEAIVLLQKV